MNKSHYFFIKNKKTTSLMEIMLAVVVLAFTFMPIIATIGTSTKDTDVANSYVFAQTTARNILDTLLDDVPFNSINKGDDGVGTLEDYTANGKTYSVSSFKEMIGIGTDDDRCQGVLTDERGIIYNITIYVEPIFDDDFYFTYLPRPRFEIASNSDTGASNWYNIPSNDSEKKSKAFLNPNSYDPYELSTEAYTVAAESKKLSELWQVENDNLSVMKKILLKIEWTGRDNKNRSLEIYTMKANLDTLG